jgi:predicted methyltransferase
MNARSAPWSLSPSSRAPVFAALGLLGALVPAACGGSSERVETADDAARADDAAPVQVETGSIEAALAGAHRSESNRARDRYRRPARTLAFFGLEPSMHVIEMGPGGGWYTEVLAPVLRDEGRLTLAMADPEQSRFARRLVDRMAAQPEIYDQVDRVVFALPDNASLGPDGSADMVLTFRSTHGWINGGGAPQIYEAMYRVLRPGGVLGVVQHRADDDADPTESARSGYVPEPYVIQLATDAGFVLEESSDINRNPADDHDHPRGVWTLPPSLRLGDTDREQYLQIGESDRMTLRFRKPAEGEAGAAEAEAEAEVDEEEAVFE